MDVLGVTLSAEQAVLARRRAAETGPAEHVRIRVQDYRDVDDGPFDTVASIGMSEHVGRKEIAGYAQHLHDLLRPGGRLLDHAISFSAGRFEHDPDTFISRYIFPDGDVLGVFEMIGAMEAADLEVLDVEALRRHYPPTLRAWAQHLEEHWAEAVQLAGEGRVDRSLGRVGETALQPPGREKADSRIPWPVEGHSQLHKRCPFVTVTPLRSGLAGGVGDHTSDAPTPRKVSS